MEGVASLPTHNLSPLSQSRHGDMACETLYIRKHVQSAHACATHLLAQGLTLTEVGGHLGHSTPEATLVYAKVDMNAQAVLVMQKRICAFLSLLAENSISI